MTNKGKLYFWLDVINALLFLGLTVTGIVMKWGFPHGPDRRTATLLWMTKHTWEDVHFWVALAFIAAIALHIVLHAGFIKNALATSKRATAS